MSALRRLAARLVWMVPFAALISTACEHNPTGGFPVASIVVTETTETLVIGTSVQFTATGYDANGTVVGIRPTWSTAGGGGTAINQAGVFTAGTTPVTNTVTATAGGVSGTATAIVIAGAAASITVTPTPVTLGIGATQQYTAVVKDASGNVLPISPNWSVVGGGTITNAGRFTAGTLAGIYPNTVTASVGSVSGSATVTVNAGALAIITVTPNPKGLATSGTQQFTAVGTDAYFNVVSITPTWSVVNATAGSINNSGMFTAGIVGGTFLNTVKACSTALCGSGSVSGVATVTVTTGALATITVTPNPVTVGTSASQQFTAVGQDANGNVIPILPAPTWSVKTGNAGGSVSSGTGFYTAPTLAGVGVDTVVATSGLISGIAKVNVSASGALVSITVTPNPASIALGGTQQFVATGFDATGLIVPIPGLTWSVVDATAGSITNTGLFTTGTVLGTFANTVKACSTALCAGGSVSGYATVTVTAVPPSFLGAAATHGILAGSAVSCAGAPGSIGADVSVWPGSAISGFPPCTLTGLRNAADAYAQTAQGDLTTAYNALAAMACGTTITADLGGTTLAEGVYCSTSSVGVTGTLTLTGNANSIFVIRAASTLTTAGNVVMAGTAQAKNVYWWVGSSATLGVGSAWQGNILALQSITLAGGVNLTGRALARNGAVSLNGIGNTITLP